jgi:hypothetical protein
MGMVSDPQHFRQATFFSGGGKDGAETRLFAQAASGDSQNEIKLRSLSGIACCEDDAREWNEKTAIYGRRLSSAGTQKTNPPTLVGRGRHP